MNIFKWLNCRPKAPIPKAGNKMVWLDGAWIEVCATCGGNCGQCGTSVGMGVPASMENLIKSLHK